MPIYLICGIRSFCSGISEWSVVDDYLTTSLYKFGYASAIGAVIMAFGLRKFSSLGGCRCRASSGRLCPQGGPSSSNNFLKQLNRLRASAPLNRTRMPMNGS